MNPEKERLVLGIDVGGTKVCMGVVTENGASLIIERYPMRMEVFLEDLFEHIDKMLSEYHDKKQFLGIGIGIKGLVDERKQMLISSSILQAASSYDLCGELRKRYGLCTAIDNDAHAAAIAELKFGVGRDCKDFVYVNVGTGTAAGIVCGGKLVRGHANVAGELGACICERYDEPRLYTLESVVSGRGLDEEARRLMPRHLQSNLRKKLSSGEILLSAEIFDACRKGDALAEAVVANALDTLSLAIINMTILLNPVLFVFGGGVVTDGWFVEQLDRKVKILCEETSVAWTADFQISELGANNVGMLGAASILLEAMEQKARA